MGDPVADGPGSVAGGVVVAILAGVQDGVDGVDGGLGALGIDGG